MKFKIDFDLMWPIVGYASCLCATSWIFFGLNPKFMIAPIAIGGLIHGTKFFVELWKSGGSK